MGTSPLDVDDLLGELHDAEGQLFGLPAGTAMGHVHLQVAGIPETIDFYRDVLGFALQASLGTAVFFAAGGYHHHIGANTWHSLGASPPPSGSAALRHVTIVLPDTAERDRIVSRVVETGLQPEAHPDGVLVRDASGNQVVLAASS